MICQTLTGTRKVDISLSRGRIGCVVRKNGKRCPVVILKTLGLSSGIQVNSVCSSSFVLF